ncbi:hypothetical protein [Oscillatoria acuminata]|uniref:Uncharacterized protein n=1 Tax=Oscillatoria acuminata PCC 6304 TaxID=56110 RepID=K9TEN1_9CYAN|nr:hypothetical protein [Oscillatoria acuminata]AFY80474.1 hypothetical protein Oscil6304_0736 [Oscillatoria acuminata PCC 6304]
MKINSSLAQYCDWARLLLLLWVSFLEEVAGDFPLLERSHSLRFAMNSLLNLYDHRPVQFRQLQVFTGSFTPGDRRSTLPSTPTMGGYFLTRL